MVLCWGEGHGSAIHDHANAHCVMKILQGKLCEVRKLSYGSYCKLFQTACVSYKRGIKSSTLLKYVTP